MSARERASRAIRPWIAIAACCALYLCLKLLMLSAGRAYFDEGVYVAIARHFASLGSAGTFESIRPLGVPALLAPLQWLPLDPLVTGRALCLLLALACIPLMHRIASRQFSREAGLWAAALVATSSSVLINGGLILTDVPAFALAVLALSLALERRYAWSGLALGVAFLLKFPVLLAAAPCAALIAWQERRRAWRHGARFALALACAMAPYFLFNLLHYGGPPLARMLTPLLDASAIVGRDTWLYTPTGLARYLPALLLWELPACAGVALALLLAHEKHARAIAAFGGCSLLFLAYFCVGVARFDPRYLVALALPLIPLAGLGIASARARAGTRGAARVVGAVFLATMAIVAGASTAAVAQERARTDAGVADAIAQSRALATNSGIALLDARGRAQLMPGPDLSDTYVRYATDPGLDMLALDLDEYPCPPGDAACARSLDARVNRIAERTTLRACGQLRGRRMLVVGKGGAGALAPDACLARLGVPALPGEGTRLFVRINEASLTPGGTLAHEETIGAVVDELARARVPTILVLSASNASPDARTRAFLSALPPATAVAITPGGGADLGLFAARVAQARGEAPAIFVPEGDDWDAGTALPASVRSCVRGPWDQAIAPVPCRAIDLYAAPEGRIKGLGDSAALVARLHALEDSNGEIGVDIPASLLTPQGAAQLRPLLLAIERAQAPAERNATGAGP